LKLTRLQTPYTILARTAGQTKIEENQIWLVLPRLHNAGRRTTLRRADW
jgi:hypothetical protein